MQRTEHGHWRSREVARLMALVESERRYYEDLLTILPYPVAVVSANGEMQSANRAFLRRFGLRASDLDSARLATLLPGVEPARGRYPGWEVLAISRFAEEDDEGDLLLIERAEPPAAPPPAPPVDPAVIEVEANRAAAASSARLAGRVLHEVNNLLMVFSGYGEEILQALPEDNPLREDMRELLRSTERIRTMAGHLQQCARPPRPVATSFELGAVLSALAAREPRLGHPAVYGEAWVTADRGQCERALTELARYARQTLAVQLTGQTVLIDGLPGPAEQLRQELEPLSTASRQGSGGLGAVPALLAQSGAGWRIIDRPDGSAALELRFAAGSPTPAGPPRRALVVDDEEGIRQLVRKVLERGGYAVSDAPSGEAALDLLALDAGKFDVLVTDMMMPGMTGRELATRVRAVRPETRVLFISGYTEDNEVVSGRLQPGTRFLAKPFQHSALLEAVTRLLGE